MYGKENPTFVDKVCAVWNYQSEDDKLIRERQTFNHSDAFLRYIAMLLTVLALFLYVENYQEWYQAISFTATMIFSYLLVQGVERTSNFNLYMIRLWLLALFVQIPFVILTESIKLNGLFLLFAGALLVKGGVKYLPLYVLLIYLVPIHDVWIVAIIVPAWAIFKKYKVSVFTYMILFITVIMFGNEHLKYSYIFAIAFGATLIEIVRLLKNQLQMIPLFKFPRKLYYYGYFIIITLAVLYKYL
ncbi:hypothetical protein ABD91_20385 [Lysinibacillus sphaericus]|uniref:hypothetical protein n=1 Tax=Lysinibacillus sphaericus TaxID=1421 RepID=UPI0018CE3E13|nr:hypothetical protein [Lysinibacillus sphaericus]MBG9693107.1 hypothetical protein [Lysinibacillus sphaericus]